MPFKDDKKRKEYHKNKNHCPQGHEYTKENSYFPLNGRRHCKICTVQNTRQWRFNKKIIKLTNNHI